MTMPLRRRRVFLLVLLVAVVAGLALWRIVSRGGVAAAKPGRPLIASAPAGAAVPARLSRPPAPACCPPNGLFMLTP